MKWSCTLLGWTYKWSGPTPWWYKLLTDEVVLHPGGGSYLQMKWSHTLMVEVTYRWSGPTPWWWKLLADEVVPHPDSGSYLQMKWSRTLVSSTHCLRSSCRSTSLLHVSFRAFITLAMRLPATEVVNVLTELSLFFINSTIICQWRIRRSGFRGKIKQIIGWRRTPYGKSWIHHWFGVCDCIKQ